MDLYNGFGNNMNGNNNSNNGNNNQKQEKVEDKAMTCSDYFDDIKQEEILPDEEHDPFSMSRRNITPKGYVTDI